MTRTLRLLRIPALIAGLLIAGLSGGSAQSGLQRIRGFVIGSDEGSALAGVHIFARKTRRGFISNSRGAFDLEVLAGDTLIFSHVGYRTERIAVSTRSGETELLLRMHVKPIELPGLTIAPEMESPYLRRDATRADLLLWRRPPTYDTTVTDVPLGSLDYGPLSYLSGEAREKRKMLRYYQEEQAEKVYNQTVTSDSVREVFMDRYGLSRGDFDEFIVHFNSLPVHYNRNDRRDIVRSMHEAFLKYIYEKPPER